MNRIRLTFLGMVFLTMVSGRALAGPSVTITFDDPIFSAGWDNVHITFPREAAGGTETAHVSAGRFTGSASNLTGVDKSIFVDGVNSVFMYCYDLYDAIQAGVTVPYAINFGAVMSRTLKFLGAVNSVLNEGKSTYDPYAWVRPTMNGQSAAIQLGLWESKYELAGNGLSLEDGSFYAANVNDATSGWVDDFFTAAATDVAPLEQKFTMLFESPEYQDMIAADPPGTVPAPGTLALMLLALVGLWRRGTAVTAAIPATASAR